MPFKNLKNVSLALWAELFFNIKSAVSKFPSYEKESLSFYVLAIAGFFQ